MEHIADERGRHRVGAHAVARDAAGGAGGTDPLLELIAGIIEATGVFVSNLPRRTFGWWAVAAGVVSVVTIAVIIWFS